VALGEIVFLVFDKTREAHQRIGYKIGQQLLGDCFRGLIAVPASAQQVLPGFVRQIDRDRVPDTPQITRMLQT
jgi:hypothetical protein